MGGERKSSEYSSGEEDGDAEWRKSINSVSAAAVNAVSAVTPLPDDARQVPKPKHYQIKVQKLLDDMLEKSLVMVKEDEDDDDDDDDGNDNDIHVPDSDPLSNGCGGIRLFKHSTPGISLHEIDESQPPRKRPKILPGEEINEKSNKFKQRLQSVAVDGEAIMAAAKNVGLKSLVRLEAKNAAAKEAAKREEERVAELKRVRGEKWLPSLARQKM